MSGKSVFRAACICLFLSLPATASAGQVITSTSRNVNAVMQASGYRIVPAGTADPRPGDLAPVQLFELVRPNGESVTINRLHTSCICVVLEASKRTFTAGERAIFELHNVKATPESGQMYAIYIQVNSPIRTTLRYDTFVQSSQFSIPSVTLPAQPAGGGDTGYSRAKSSDPMRVGPEDDLEPVMTHIPDPHARAEIEPTATPDKAENESEPPAPSEPAEKLEPEATNAPEEKADETAAPAKEESPESPAAGNAPSAPEQPAEAQESADNGETAGSEAIPDVTSAPGRAPHADKYSSLKPEIVSETD